ncbi:hypothetical protein A2V82_01925 [candidate division KSB1 bacterium RBG_16_48_16]|nr:MAG: hypothetical protein A2V82_01925 [candidate division KSB1 bacterium RBG_16_48_16]
MYEINAVETYCRIVRRCRIAFSSLLASVALIVCILPVQGQTDHPMNFAGDFRVRFESTSRQQPGATPDIRDARNREVVRFRFGINRRINGLFNFGARLATGSPDDPNTTDVTMGDFVNDLSISLDRAFMELKYQNLFLTGGKFANPFRTTELLWDGDVNLQGIAGSYTLPGAKKIVPKVSGAYYVVDEQSSNPDSYMLGGQLDFAIHPSPDLSLTLAGAYYDYTIKSLTHADPPGDSQGDTRGNFLTADGKAYLSDFDLIEGFAAIDYRGFGERYPVRLVGDFVKNNGAARGEDMGYGIDLYVGKVSKNKDWRFQYGYALAENDAVLAAFSHDNTTLASNYEQYTLGIDYVIAENTTLTLTLYHYRRHHLKSAHSIENDFFTRLRLNAMVNF